VIEDIDLRRNTVMFLFDEYASIFEAVNFKWMYWRQHYSWWYISGLGRM
jgi:hypothetical protein